MGKIRSLDLSLWATLPQGKIDSQVWHALHSFKFSKLSHTISLGRYAFEEDGY